MEETIMNQDEIMEETALVPTEDVSVTEPYLDEECSNGTSEIGVGVVLAIGALAGIGAKLAYDKVGKPVLKKAKYWLKNVTTKRKEKGETNKEDAVEVEYHDTDDSVESE